jgi:RHS repeat-associated protein
VVGSIKEGMDNSFNNKRKFIMFNLKQVMLSLVIVLATLFSIPNTFAGECTPIQDDSWWESFLDDPLDTLGNFFDDALCTGSSWLGLSVGCDEESPDNVGVKNIGSSYSVQDTIDYTLTGEDNDELSLMYFRVFHEETNTTKYGIQCEVNEESLSDSGNDSGSFTTENWLEGKYSYTLLVFDSAGNYEEYNDSFELIEPTPIDTEKPSGRIVGIDDSYSVGDEISYTIIAEDNQELAFLEFSLMNIKLDDMDEAYTKKSVSGTSTKFVNSFSTSNWTEGKYFYSLHIEDVAGNSIEDNGSFDLIKPDSDDTEPDDDIPPDDTNLDDDIPLDDDTPPDDTNPDDDTPPDDTNPDDTEPDDDLKPLPSVTPNPDFVDKVSQLNSCDRNVKHRGDPIDTSTGAQVLSHSLLTVQGVVPISFDLFYNSLLLKEDKVGRAWNFKSYGARLEELDNGDITIYWLNTQYNHFSKKENGDYESSHFACRFDTLVKNGDNGFTLSRKNKTVYQFDANGQLVTLLNYRGQPLNLDYDDAGQLTKITEPVSDVFIKYSYNNNGLLETVVDSLNRQVRLGYDNDNNLTTITDAIGQTTTYTYNSLGQTLTAVNNDGVQLFKNTYDEQGRIATQDDGIDNNQPLKLVYDESQPNQIITTVTDRAGKQRVYTYDDNYQLLSLKDELGNTVSYTYNKNGQRTNATDANGNTTRFAYDDNGNLITITDVADNVTQLAYDDNQNLLSVTDTLGKKTKLTYDTNHNLVNTIDALGNVTKFSYNANGQIVKVTNPSGAVTTYKYEQSRPIGITDPEGHTQTLSYDAAGRLTSVTDAEGHITTLVYNAVNQLVKVTDALERSVSMTYDSRGNLLTFTDAKDNATKRSYDGNGNLISKTNALAQKTEYVYDGEDRLIEVIDAKGHSTTLDYDEKGRLVSVTDAAGHSRKLSYDAADNVLSQIDALDKTVATFQYDALNNLTHITDALQNTSELKYDTLSRLTKVIDPLKNVTQFNYDDVDRLVSSLDAEEGKSSQAYDNNGNLTSITDPNSHETGFKFDNNGRLVEEHSAAGGKVRYTYNARDLLVEVTNAREQQRQLDYDAVGRLIRLTDADGEITYTYDDNDNVLTVTDANGKITREYDALDRVIKYTDNQNNTLQYAYDEIGHLITLIYPDNKQVSYEYNAVGQLIKVMDWAQRETQYDYNANGRLVQVKRPNNTQMTRRYDDAGQLLQQQDIDSKGETISQFDFSYDHAGDIVEEQILPEPAPFPLESVNMTYTAANRLATFNDKSVSFDADGNMTQGPLNGEMVDFAFDSRNRLSNVGSMDYRYDAENQRIGVSVSGEETRYVINPQAVLSQALVRTAPDGKKTFYVYGLGLIGEETDSDYQAYHFDLRGSTVALTDATGNVVERFAYSPYGGLVSGQSPVEIDTPFLFNGMYGVMTDDTGLYYMRARYYNPEIRRFINQDPLMLGFVAEGQTLNRYAYVTGEPVSYVDPFGLWAGVDDAIAIVGGATVGVIGQGISDLIKGEVSPWYEYVGSAVGGAVAAETTLYLGPIVGGAAGGFAGSLVKQGFDDEEGIDWGSVALDTTLGGLTSTIKLPKVKIPGITSGRGSFSAVNKQMNTKFMRGQISNIKPRTAMKMFTAQVVENIPGELFSSGVSLVKDFFQNPKKKTRNRRKNKDCDDEILPRTAIFPGSTINHSMINSTLNTPLINF